MYIDAWPVVLKHEYTNCNLFARQNLRSICTLLIIIAQKMIKKMLLWNIFSICLEIARVCL